MLEWFWFDAWRQDPAGWRRLYSRGPMHLSRDDAREELIDTMESFAQLAHATRAFRWTGRAWEPFA